MAASPRACHTAVDDLERHMLAEISPAEAAAFRSLLERTLGALTSMRT